MQYRVYEAERNAVGGIEGVDAGSEYIEAESAEAAATRAADGMDWDRDDWDGGDVVVATDDDGDSYHLSRDAYLAAQQ